MKNYEKYADEIRKYKGDNFCIDFVLPNIMESNDCSGNCDVCRIVQMIWFMEECKEPEEPEEPKVDWSKVEVDTPILVRQTKDGEWLRRHFAKYEDGIVYTWKDGHTSWTEDCMTGWDYGKAGRK